MSPADPSLLELQRGLLRVLLDGPAHVSTVRFGHDADRTLMGLRVHANTISHARLVALEDTFPRTRAELGVEAFQALSRSYLDAGHGLDRLDLIGLGFPDWLAGSCVDGRVVTLAHLDRAWLESYHAAEQKPMTWLDVQACADADAVLGLSIGWHHALRVVDVTHGLADTFADGVGGPGDPAMVALATVRPDAEVTVVGLSAPERCLLETARGGVTIGACLDRLVDPGSGEPVDGFDALVRLVDAGAFALVQPSPGVAG